jgi:hypothetical protein
MPMNYDQQHDEAAQVDDMAQVDADLLVLERLQRFRVDFAERICAASKSKSLEVLSVLQLEAMHPFAEFFFLLRARCIETEADLERLADSHNSYIVGLTKNQEKVERMGLKPERLMQAIFTGDTLPRLLGTWREHPGSIDQSNLGRFLVAVMSTETARKLVVACSEAGFLDRVRTPFGTVVVRSTGTMERVYGICLRELRVGVQGNISSEHGG